ncbi:MAG: DEAD/DEAH box helicase [Saprospiraceae bacterium]|nr:DEAD/DEAH box helicase [Saprospiraceae bacterium]
MSNSETIEKYTIVYNLYGLENQEIVLPNAFVCKIDKDGQPSYIEALALPETILSFGIDIKESVHEKLLSICNDLNTKSLENHFNRGSKRELKLSSLFEDKTTKSILQSYLDKKLVGYLTLIKDHKLHICFDLQRSIKAIDVILNFENERASPDLFFIKTQTGLRYTLSLRLNDIKIIPCHDSVLILTDRPSWIVIGRQIIEIQYINSAKLKPFLKNESIFVPEKLIRNYFEQFIKDLLGSVDIETEGFIIEKVTELQKSTLVFKYDIFRNKWVGDIVFDYSQFRLNYSHPGKRKNTIEFDQNDNIKIRQCIRNSEQENNLVRKLLDLKLYVNENSNIDYGTETYDLIHFSTKHYHELSTFLIIENPEIDGKNIQFNEIKVQERIELVNDWFDLKGTLVIGSETYPISKLFRHIRNSDPFFEISNKQFIILPKELFTRFESLVKFSIENSECWKISKKYHSLISDAKCNFQSSTTILSISDIEYHPSSKLRATLRTYQVEGVTWLVNHRLNDQGACLADDMGLGKTLQTIAALLHAKENIPESDIPDNEQFQLNLFENIVHKKKQMLNALIVLPASLVFNWYAEFKKYAPTLHVLKYVGNKRHKAQKTILTFDVILTTYHTLISDVSIFKDLYFQYIVLDESQQIRNKSSRIFQVVNNLTARSRLSLSGTPIENSLSDLWSQMEFINPSILGSFSFFKENYKFPIENNRDPIAIAELKTLVEPFILRRTKEQVASDLPELIETIHFSEMSFDQSKCYEREKSAARNYLLGLTKTVGNFKFHVLTSLLKLRQIANHPFISDKNYSGDSGKFEDIKDMITTLVKSNHKVLIFSGFLKHLDLLEKWLIECKTGYVTLSGEMDSEQRENSVRSFQNKEETLVFLLSIKAGGTGLNLTGAEYVFILDPWWNPFVEKQAIARAHRIGQNKTVMVTRFISKNTVEEKILKLQDKKKMLSDDIIANNEWADLNEQELMDMLA